MSTGFGIVRYVGNNFDEYLVSEVKKFGHPEM